MTGRSRSPVDASRRRRPWLRAAKVAALALLFLPLAYAGIEGQRSARRRGQVEEIRFCRDSLQKALDAQRSAAAGPTPKRSAAAAGDGSRPVREWAAKLSLRAAAFRSTHAPPSEAEDLELKLSEALVAIAERRCADALRTLGAAAERIEPDGPGTRDRLAEILRLRADAHYDMQDWPAALEHSRQLLLRRPGLLSAVERVAQSLDSLKQTDGALDTYAELAKRLHQRGSRLLAHLDHAAAVQDLNTAVTIRLWLREQGRLESAADLAATFSSCAAALVELGSLDLAAVYAGHAINIRSQLIAKQHRDDLGGDLADDHALRARVLLESRKADEALADLDSAIGIVEPLIQAGRLDLRKRLAMHLAHRGIVRQTRGQTDAAVRDFERAAEVFAASEDFAAAVAWQTRALAIVAGPARAEAQSRLNRYRSGAGR
jgi:tetratricopeptide (TPR) repeat protein